MGTTLADPLVGRVLDGRYRVDARLARGGMSTVYSGVDLRLDRPVAVKVMAPALAADPSFVARFDREARAAARLAHPNVVAVFDQGASDGHVFLVMELVAGRTLRELLTERGRLPADEALSLLEPVLAALSAAHWAGLVHRDVKPENVLLGPDGSVKVADFGLARAVAAATTVATQAGTVFGTVAYVAPEQVMDGRADPRTDVYAAGIMLYELLTGAPPYAGNSAIEVAYRHVHDDVPPPSAIVPGLAPALDDLVTHATRRQPGARPADAGAFLAAVGHVRADLGLRRVPVRGAGGRPGPGRVAPGDGGVTTSRVPMVAGPGSTAALPVGGPAAPARPAAPAPAPGPQPGGLGPARRPAAADRDEQRAHLRRVRFGLIAVLLLGLAAGATGWRYGDGRLVAVPALAGLSQPAAVAAAHSAGLEARIGPARSSDTVPPGIVVGSSPGSGRLVRRGATITLVPSGGPAPVVVPALTGRSAQDAVGLLRATGLGSSVTMQTDPTATGTVIGQSPGAGAGLRRGTVVTLVVSKGPSLVAVPGVIGRRLGRARTILEQDGFGVRERDVLGGQAGLVLGQDPPAGTQVPPGSVVTIDVI